MNGDPAKPLLLMDQHFRRVEELFRPGAFEELVEHCNIYGGINWPMDRAKFLSLLPDAEFVVAAHPELSRDELANAPKLRAIIEVAGTFQAGLDFDTCFERGIEVLSCAPGFRYSVAEMALGLILAGARGIVDEHERFRHGTERWRHDNMGADFSLYRQSFGFVGYGSIAQECTRLLAPFSPKITAFDPWLQASGRTFDGVEFCDLATAATTNRCVIIAATPTDENYQLVNRALVERMPLNTLVVIISRSHLVDFDSLVEAADAGRIRLASDVFPDEPVKQLDPVRYAANTIWSPHRAAAVDGGRHPIGDMILHDVRAILAGRPERQLQAASRETVKKIIHAQLAAG